jgi:flagellar biosynthesis protein FlhF
MRLRSFHGENLSEAIRQVRDELGNDAIIVATRDDENGGVRVTAALDESILLESEKLPMVEAPAPIDMELDVVELAADQLMRHGASAALSEQLLAVVTHFADHDILIALGASLDKHFNFGTLIDGSNRPLCLVGMPGAGKTLAIAKLAANRVLNKKNVGVITTDLTRAGAIEQLSAYTKLLKVNLIEVEDAHTLKDAIDSHKRNEMVLIDNSGRNPFNKSDMQSLKEIANAADMDPVLVMPAGVDAMEATDIAHAFKEIGAKKLIVTKLDMARRLGSLMTMAYETGLALCEYSASPKATEPLIPLNPVTFARLLLPADIVAAVLKSKAVASGE